MPRGFNDQGMKILAGYMGANYLLVGNFNEDGDLIQNRSDQAPALAPNVSTKLDMLDDCRFLIATCPTF